MKFVTEQDLRESYLKSPFSSYVISKDVKLTPGGRQFLADRKILLSSSDERKEETKLYKSDRLNVKFQWIRSLFLAAGGQLLDIEPILAQKIFGMDERLREVSSGIDQEKGCSPLEYRECTGIKQEDFSKDLGDCFEITSFHVQMERGRGIIELHRLRCGLRELICCIEDMDRSDTGQKQLLIKKTVLPMINQLNQMICLHMGGGSCQR